MREHLYLGKPCVSLLLPDLPEGEVAVHSSVSPSKDTGNEDSAAVLSSDDRSIVLAVADGVGGQAAGQAASALALEALRDCVFAAGHNARSVREAILSGFERANRAVLALGLGAATTLSVAEISDGEVQTYHAGDSGVLVFGGRGKLKLQTIAHSPVGYAYEAGIIDEDSAMSHDERHLVSNVVGDRDLHIAMSSRLRLRPKDTLVIASDGLFDNLYVEEIVEQLRHGRLAHSTRMLVGECRHRMVEQEGDRPSKADDLTVLAFRGHDRRARAGV